MLIEQRSEAWFELRKGKITSSEFHKIMGEGRGKDGLSETAKTYLLEKVAESFNGFLAPTSGIALDWGRELEDMALEIYKNKAKQPATKCSFIQVNEHYGGSPDALVEDRGAVEIKCPYNSTNHFKHGLIKSDAEFKKVAPAYYYQAMSHILVSNAKWCDFVSFDPRVDEKYMMFIYRLHRDEEEIQNMKAKLEVAVEYMKELRAIFEAKVEEGTIEA